MRIVASNSSTLDFKQTWLLIDPDPFFVSVDSQSLYPFFSDISNDSVIISLYNWSSPVCHLLFDEPFLFVFD